MIVAFPEVWDYRLIACMGQTVDCDVHIVSIILSSFLSKCSHNLSVYRHAMFSDFLKAVENEGGISSTQSRCHHPQHTGNDIGL